MTDQRWLTLSQQPAQFRYSMQHGQSVADYPGLLYVQGQPIPSMPQLASPSGSSLIGFTGPNNFYVPRTVQSKQRDVVSIMDFGADPTGATLSDNAFTRARQSGASEIYIPTGIYLTTGAVFDNTDNVKCLWFARGGEIKLQSAANRIALDIQKQAFDIRGVSTISGTGLNNDGLGCIGVRHGTTVQGQSYLNIEHMIIRENFSRYGFVSYANVNVQLGMMDVYAGNVGAGSTCYGVAFLPGASGSTLVSGKQLYINGGLRGFYADSLSWAVFHTLAIEYAGNQSDAEYNAALHLARCSIFMACNLYGEANARNMVMDDATAVFVNRQMLAAPKPDVISYNAVAFDQRGVAEMTNRQLKIGEIIGDPSVDISTTSGLKVSGVGAGQRIGLNGVNILAVQQPNVAEPVDGATVDIQARTAINEILSLLRTHGLMSA